MRRKRLRSGLEDIAGVGQKTRTLLLKTLGSLRAIAAATEEELRAAGATAAQAERIVQHFATAPRLEEAEEDAVDGSFASGVDAEADAEGVEDEELMLDEETAEGDT
jgi:ERCC4-type nuclease